MKNNLDIWSHWDQNSQLEEINWEGVKEKDRDKKENIYAEDRFLT